MGAVSQTFPAEVVKELRGKAGRYRERARNLEDALIRLVINEAASRAGVDPSSIPIDTLALVSIDDSGVIHGAAEAVASLKP